ncbi:MAG: hypothetical protein M3O22_00050 [Pseudomonadota bacterium]|nr:hypothetical protein [Pseudomonadota bacterium]
MRNLSLKLSALATAAIMTGWTSSEAHAQTADLLGITGATRAQLFNIPLLLSWVAYIIGALFIISGLLKLRAHIDNPGQAPLQHALARIGVGAGLIVAPFVAAAAVNTFGGSTGSTGPGIATFRTS